jgi:hypothetical protein
MKSTIFLVLLFIVSLLAFGATQVISGKLKPMGNLSLFNFKPQLDIHPVVSNSGVVQDLTPKVEPPVGISNSDLSPWYGQVKISSFTPNRSFGDRNGFVLNASLSSTKSISVTGWQIKANRWDVRIPSGANDYPPYGLLPEGNITLESGGVLRAQYGVSPIGKNFRPNICSNYLKQTYTFDPQLPYMNCPSVYTREEIAVAAGTCQNLLLSIQNSCRPATSEETSKLTYMEFRDCEPFLKRLNYNDCYSKNKGTADFYSKEWIVWLKNPVLADKDHDQILLLDEKGLLVDKYIY